MTTEKTIAALAAALAHPARLRVVDLLGAHQRLTAGDLAEYAGMSPAAMSHHLRQLRLAGLIASEPQTSSYLYYRLAERYTTIVVGALRELAARVAPGGAT